MIVTSFFHSIVWSVLLACCVYAQAPAQAPVHTATQLHSFAIANTSIAGVTARENGVLLLALADRAEIFAFDPLTPNSIPQLVLRFKGGARISGITELGGDVLAVLVGAETSTTLWNVTFTNRLSNTVTSKKVGGPYAGLRNLGGMTKALPHAVLAADSDRGKVHRISLADGAMTEVAADPKLTGIVDIDLYDGSLYYTSGTQGILGRVPLNNGNETSEPTYEATGPPEVLASNLKGAGGFAFASWTQGENGAVFVANHPQNEVVKFDLFEKTSVKAASVPSPINLAAGSTEKDADLLYIVTSKGGIFSLRVML